MEPTVLVNLNSHLFPQILAATAFLAAWVVVGGLVGLAMGGAESLGGRREVVAVLKRAWRRLGLVALLALSLGGCITNDYTRAHEARLRDAVALALEPDRSPDPSGGAAGGTGTP